MATPATLLDSAIDEAIIYLKANNGGTRAGLIVDLVQVVGISAGTAGNWIDALTAEVFNLGMSADVTYAAFKAWLQSVGPIRGEAGTRRAFNDLKETTLIADARSQIIAKFNDAIAIVDSTVVNINTVMSTVTSKLSNTDRTIALRALNLYVNKLQSKRNLLVVERDKVTALVG